MGIEQGGTYKAGKGPDGAGEQGGSEDAPLELTVTLMDAIAQKSAELIALQNAPERDEAAIERLQKELDALRSADASPE